MLWHDGVGEGFDRCTRILTTDGARLQGTARVPDLGSFRYTLHCDHGGNVDWLEIKVDMPFEARTMDLRRGSRGWVLDGAARDDFDADAHLWLSLSPVGLTATAKRLSLAEGESRSYAALTVDVATQTIWAGEHSLRCISAGHFVHDAGNGAGERHVHLGPHGLVGEYEDAWKAVAFA